MKIEDKIDKYLKEGCTKKVNEEGDKYQCKCGWVYDPAKTGKEFSEEPADYKCPECGAGKSAFHKM